MGFASPVAGLEVNGDVETSDRTGWDFSPATGVTDAVASFDVFGSDGPGATELIDENLEGAIEHFKE